MAAFSTKIITSDRVFFDGRVEIIIVPGLRGEKAFMAHHEEMVIALRPGEIRFKTEDGKWQTAINGYGVASCANNRLQVIVESAEYPEDIDEARAKLAQERAMEEMRQKQSIQEYRCSQASLARAINRLRHVNHSHYDI